MPSNVIKINNDEYIIPDSWMEPLMAYIDLLKEKKVIEGYKQERKFKVKGQPFGDLKKINT